MDSLQVRMSEARCNIIQAVNIAIKTYDLPAFILEAIIADVLGEMRNASKVELLRELESKNAESVQSYNVEE